MDTMSRPSMIDAAAGDGTVRLSTSWIVEGSAASLPCSASSSSCVAPSSFLPTAEETSPPAVIDSAATLVPRAAALAAARAEARVLRAVDDAAAGAAPESSASFSPWPAAPTPRVRRRTASGTDWAPGPGCLAAGRARPREMTCAVGSGGKPRRWRVRWI